MDAKANISKQYLEQYLDDNYNKKDLKQYLDDNYNKKDIETNILSSCSPVSAVIQSKSYVIYNETKRTIHIHLLCDKGVANQANVITIPSAYRMSFLSGYSGYNGMKIVKYDVNGTATAGMSVLIVFNGDGQVRSSHSANEATAQPMYIDFSYKLD